MSYKKTEDPDQKSVSSVFVSLTGLFSEPFLSDLETIWELYGTVKINI
jgi:hypothetical protein